jgi:thiol-disulfide isomerase/thioredoxin
MHVCVSLRDALLPRASPPSGHCDLFHRPRSTALLWFPSHDSVETMAAPVKDITEVWVEIEIDGYIPTPHHEGHHMTHHEHHHHHAKIKTWEQVMHETENRLVVIDMHHEWCGPCVALIPSISRLLLDVEDCQTRFLYCTASFMKVEEHIKEAVAEAGNGLDLEKNGCVPLFGVFKVRIS